MKNKDLIKMADPRQGLAICGTIKGIKASYAIAKNSRKVESELKPLNEEIEKLQVSHAKVKDGKPLIENGRYVMKDDEKWTKAYNELVDIDIKVDFHMLDIKELPGDVTVQQMSAMLPFINSEEEKPKKK